MNRRIEKKKHAKYITDVGIEICQDKQWELRLLQLGIGESLPIETANLPTSFFKIRPAASAYKLFYEVSRVELSSIPSKESAWWQVNENTIFLAFYPTDFKQTCWYAAINQLR